MTTFGTRLHQALRNRGPLCVGIDPLPGLLHAWGLDDDPAGLETFALTCVDALAGDVAVLKPQSAFFERHGSAGIAVLERVVSAVRGAGCLVLLDAKRGDVGPTMQGYADAYLDPSSPMAVDAVTVSPFLGFGSLRPMLDTAARHDAGVFVLALTSNPDAPEVQGARAGGTTVAGQVLDSVRAENDGARPMGSVGVVVGANLAAAAEDLDVGGPILAPGFGAQGGTVDDVRRLFGSVRSQVLPSSSRGILGAGPAVDALRTAAARTNDQIREALGA